MEKGRRMEQNIYPSGFNAEAASDQVGACQGTEGKTVKGREGSDNSKLEDHQKMETSSTSAGGCEPKRLMFFYTIANSLCGK